MNRSRCSVTSASNRRISDLIDADDIHDLRATVRPKQVDLRPPRPDDMDVRRLVVLSVDDDPEAVSPVNDDHEPL